MKRIDKLMLSSFGGPFAVSFAIALFVLIMQFLWLYIDDIAGKGVSIFILLELIGYLSISTFPMAFPIAVLIASVMVMGNLAERYELSSMKSAGIPLIRVMRSLIICAVGISLFSYICSDFIIPISNLKFKSRLFDIRRQKPALTLEPGVFNEDFRQFAIRIGKKARDGETIQDVMIETQQTSQARFQKTMADSGQMFTTRDRRFFVMNLFDGYQYQEPGSSSGRASQKYPFVRTKFDSWTKVWDLKEFDMSRSDEENFKGQRTMLSMKQLRLNVDSFGRAIQQTQQTIADDLLYNLKKEPVKFQHATPSAADTLKKTAPKLAPAKNIKKGAVQPPLKPLGPSSTVKLPEQKLEKPLAEYASIVETFVPADRPALLKEAANRIRTAETTVDTRKTQVESKRKEMVKTGYELFTRYSFALVCIVFLFIGAPMGAIIRKGGFGYPILVSIIFFVLFIFLTIFCRKLAELYLLSPFWAAMLPCLLLIPISSYLTIRAMNDSQMFSTERLDRFLARLRKRKSEKTVSEA